MRCYRRLLNISYKDHVTNEEVGNRIQNATGVHDDLLTMVKKRKLRWYGHISRSSGMAKTILQGTVKGARKRGRQKKRWEDNINEWTGMGFGDSLRAAEDREGWKGIVATSSVVPRRPPRLRDWDEMRCTSSEAYGNNKFYEQHFILNTVQNRLRHFIERIKNKITGKPVANFEQFRCLSYSKYFHKITFKCFLFFWHSWILFLLL